MGKLLLEIGTEEIPASYIPDAYEKMRELADQKFHAARLVDGDNLRIREQPYGSPRRLVLAVDNIRDHQERWINKVLGPPKKAAFDKDGNPTKAGTGFAKKYGKSPDDIQIEDTPKGEYTYLEIEEGGEDAVEVLKKILPEIISAITFSKTMRWGSGELRFARPIRSLLALLGGKTIEFSMEGLESGNSTFGHRFASSGTVTVNSPDDYETLLEKAGVIVDPEKRIAIIKKSLEEAGKKTGASAVPDEKLVETVCYLTENPIAVVGTFDEKYLDLPRELLITVMKHHQKYFAMENKGGKLANSFVAISNIDCPDMNVLKKGYERVLEARLADARFFFDDDKKHSLKDFQKKLAGVVYQKGLGSVADKTDRIKQIAGKIADVVCPDEKSSVETAANYCKADLTTSMVYEFPELQGVMGREYARIQGESEEVAVAIDEHYKPRFSGDDLPSGGTVTCVALADKIETVCGHFALGLIPTGSEDPYSLRRHANGVLRILLTDYGKKLPLDKLINQGIDSLPKNAVKDKKRLTDDVRAFFKSRLQHDFLSRKLPHDVIEAVLTAGIEYLPDALKRCEALAEMKKEDYCENLSISFKRASKIILGHPPTDLDETMILEPAEKELLVSLKKREKNISPLLEAKDFEGALKEVAEIRTAVDNFFDGVMVMVDDPDLRNNRLNLLWRVVQLFYRTADFSKLVY